MSSSDKQALELLKVIKRISSYEAERRTVDIEFGKVLSVDEEEIEIETEGGEKISGNNLILSDRCLPRVVNIPYDDDNTHIHDEDEMLDTLTISYVPHATYPGKLSVTTGSGISLKEVPIIPTGMSYVVNLKHKHKIHPALKSIKLWRGLAEGDIVIMIRMSSGQYFVLERSSFGDNPSNKVYNPMLKDEGDSENPDKEK